MIIERTINCRIEPRGGGDEHDIEVLLRYRTADPFAIEMVLTEHNDGCGEVITWTLSRDVMIEASMEPEGGHVSRKVRQTGAGDAIFFTSPLRVRLLLSNPSQGSATISFPRARLRDFMRCTMAEVPRGQEDKHYDADAEILALLGGRIGGGEHPVEGVE